MAKEYIKQEVEQAIADIREYWTPKTLRGLADFIENHEQINEDAFISGQFTAETPEEALKWLQQACNSPYWE